jgi:hypothetical protein
LATVAFLVCPFFLFGHCIVFLRIVELHFAIHLSSLSIYPVRFRFHLKTFCTQYSNNFAAHFDIFLWKWSPLITRDEYILQLPWRMDVNGCIGYWECHKHCKCTKQKEKLRKILWSESSSTNVFSSLNRYNKLHSNMTSFKRFESKPVVKIILIYDRLNLWRHRQFITVFYQFLHIRIEIIHGSHIYILFLPRVGLYVSFLPLAYAQGKTSWHKDLPVVKTIYTYGFHELFLK